MKFKDSETFTPELVVELNLIVIDWIFFNLYTRFRPSHNLQLSNVKYGDGATNLQNIPRNDRLKKHTNLLLNFDEFYRSQCYTAPSQNN